MTRRSMKVVEFVDPTPEHLDTYTQSHFEKMGTRMVETTRTIPRLYREVWPEFNTPLENLVGRELPHPQSAHLTDEERAKLDPRDLENIKRAEAKRARRRKR